MSETEQIDPCTLDKLMGVFKVDNKSCTDYNQIYQDSILSKIHEKFLAHLVASVEDLITEKITKKITGPGKECGYRIIIKQMNLKKVPAKTNSYEKGAIIGYKFTTEEQKNSRIIIAHELGHLLIEHKVLSGENTQNLANLFAYFAINGKDLFYRNKAPKLIYAGGEKEIIDEIQKISHIEKENEPDLFYQTNNNNRVV